MAIELVHIGFDNFIATNRIVAIASPNSITIKRIMKEAGNKGLLIDVTHGRKTRSIIITDSGHIFVTSRASEIIAGRLRIGRTEGYAGRGEPALRLEPNYENGEL